MNAGYFTLAKELFPNANVIIDLFHLVQLLNVALNKTRIRLMNQFKRWKTRRNETLPKAKTVLEITFTRLSESKLYRLSVPPTL